MSEPEKRLSSFSLTCNRLSHYMKEKATQSHHPPINGAMIPMKYMVSTHDHHPSFMSAREEKAQLTIFYEGKVMVFHDFPAGKAHELMQIASKESLTTPRPSLHSPASDLPIIRRASLYRFLEKRKERMVSKAPYQLERSSSSAVPKVGQGASTPASGAADEEPHINGQAQVYTVSSSSES